MTARLNLNTDAILFTKGKQKQEKKAREWKS